MKSEEFKKLIKETMREVLKEEFKLLRENIQYVSSNKDLNLVDINKPKNSTFTPNNFNTTTNNTLIDILNETKMSNEEYQDIGNFTTPNIGNFQNVIPSPEIQVGTVGDMLNSSTRGTMYEEQARVDVVPDFTKFMSILKDKGQI